MATVPHPAPPARPLSPVHYPDSDGNPMSDNTIQFQWIVTIQGGLDSLFADREDVFVAGDLLWYPVEGDQKTCAAPGAMVVFGRPKVPRGSYRQWEEGGIAPQVVFEVLSPSNRYSEMERKRRFYERFGVEEYYVYDPGDPREAERITGLGGWVRADVASGLAAVHQMDGWRSPRLGVVFELDHAEELRLVRPDGRPFETFVDLSRRADAERERTALERQRADAVQQLLEQERRRAELAQQRADLLAARLRAAGIDPDAA